MGHSKGEWKKYGRHIHINTSNTSDEIAYAIWPEWMPESEAEANANLMTAAPIGDELANAIICMDFDDWGDFCEVKEIARKFKDKAEGG